MQDSIQLFTAQNGLMSAKVAMPGGTFRHIHSVINPLIENKFFEKLDLWGDVIVFAGIGLGYHLTKKIKTLPKITALIIIDYYDELTLLAKNGLFAGLPNVMVFVSETSATVNQAASLLRLNPDKKVQLVKHPASFDINKNYYEQTLAEIFSQKPFFASINIPEKHCAIVLFGKFFLEEEVRLALAVSGIDPALFLYNDMQFGVDYENTLTRLIQEKRPRFILSINLKGFDGSGAFAEITQRFAVPVFVWFVDDPRPIVLHKRQSIKKNMVALTWEKTSIPFLETLGFNKVAYLPLASDATLFDGAATAAPSVPLGFVGSAMVDAFSGKIKDKFLWHSTLEPLIEMASDTLCSEPFYLMHENIRTLAHKLSIKLPFTDEKNLTWLCTYCIHEASMKKRKALIGGLMDLGVQTFGDPEGWKHLLGPEVKTNPNVDYRNSLSDTYRKICVNVNITSCQMPTSVNQRIFDIPLSGSFVISDNQKDMGELFTLGKEAIVYEDLKDLREKIAYYLTHDTLRREIIFAAQIRIKNEHLYIHRVNYMLGLL